MTSMWNRHLLMVLAVGVVCQPRVAMAGELEAAEHARLTEEMRALAARNTWEGVEKDFHELLGLQGRGETLTPEEWRLGAQAARGVGNMTACRDRLSSAVEMSADEEAVSWLAQIDSTYGRVNLSADKTLLPRPKLNAQVMPFIPDQRKAIEFAQAIVEAEMDYEGLLPGGAYDYGAETFELGAGLDFSMHLEAKVLPRSGDEPFQFAFLGPRIEVGGAFTQGGQVGDDVEAPPAFGGVGLRGGIGIEAGLNHRLGVWALVGYHGLKASIDRAESKAIEANNHFSGHSMQTGMLSLGASYRLAGLRFSGGPVISMGVAQAMNDDEVEVTELLWVTKGPMAAVGAQASLGYAVLTLGTSMEMLVSLTGGVQHDSQRAYPWAQAAMVISPSAPRSE